MNLPPESREVSRLPRIPCAAAPSALGARAGAAAVDGFPWAAAHPVGCARAETARSPEELWEHGATQPLGGSRSVRTGESRAWERFVNVLAGRDDARH
jgi:hypothetical protein